MKKTILEVFKLAQYPNIVMGRDTSDYFLKYFKSNSGGRTIQLYVYPLLQCPTR